MIVPAAEINGKVKGNFRSSHLMRLLVYNIAGELTKAL
jgi:hypothetical protein